MEQLAAKISSENFSDDELNELIRKLHSQLEKTKGRKVYGYLPPNVKKTVDDIFSRLSENQFIQKMYDLWCEMEQQKHDVYFSAKVKFPKLADNKEFKSVKNMIINQVLNMGCIVDISVADEPEPVDDSSSDDTSVEVEILDDITEPENYDESVKQDNSFQIEWSEKYKSACGLMYKKDVTIDDICKAERILLEESERGNLLSTHDLGKLYSMDKFDFKDEDKAFEFYNKALFGFMEIERNSKKLRGYVQYRIGKMHCYGLGSEQNYEKAFEWFHKASQPIGENLGNKFAQYSLANLYYYGNGVEKDLEQAFLWYQKSASQGQPYASYSLAEFYIK